jgi:nucleotide-binding universal stress UspA family protein
MTFSTISLALFADGESDNTSPIRCAEQLALRGGAHLNALVVVPPFLSPATGDLAYFATNETFELIEAQNKARKAEAESLAALVRSESERVGVVATVEVVLADREPATPRLIRLVRLSQFGVLGAPTHALSQDLAADLLFGAGAPLLFAPTKWGRFDGFRKTAIAWDGSRVAARAVRDAAPFLAESESVEIISILGEKTLGPEASASDLAKHLSRSCRDVTVNQVRVDQSGVASALREHARRGGADLLVMGAYGHSRLREFVLGGATRDMLLNIELPTLMSH